MTADISDFTSALPDGPWRHEFVTANGSRFHVATAGPTDRGVRDAGPPLIVLLHSFPEFWWAWRHQIAPLAAAGYRVAALDLRGTGASDKPPSGYDMPTRTRDVAGVIRSLGASRAVVVGHGWGGGLAWAMAALQPSVTAAVAVLAAPHPARLHAPTRRLLTRSTQRRMAFFQLPTLPERSLIVGDLVAEILAEGTVHPLPDDVVNSYRTVMRIPFAAHSAMEVARWAVRSTPRLDGRRYTLAVRRPIAVPALQVHGAADAVLHREFIDADGAALARNFRFEVIEDAGHFLHEDTPEQVTDLLLDWLATAAPTTS